MIKYLGRRGINTAKRHPTPHHRQDTQDTNPPTRGKSTLAQGHCATKPHYNKSYRCRSREPGETHYPSFSTGKWDKSMHKPAPTPCQKVQIYHTQRSHPTPETMQTGVYFVSEGRQRTRANGNPQGTPAQNTER